MPRPTIVGLSLLATLAGVLDPPAAGAQGYSFSTLTVPGATTTVATGINAAGQVVGYYSSGASRAGVHGFVYTAGVYRTIDVPTAAFTFPLGISGNGEVVGSFRVDGRSSASNFVLDGGAFSTLAIPGLPGGGVTSISNAGLIAGFGPDDPGSQVFAYDRRDGSVRTIGVNSAYHLDDAAINDAGQIVGTYHVGTGSGSYLIAGGVITLLYDPAGYDPRGFELHGINDAGVMVGQYRSHGFVGTASGFSIFDVPGGALTTGYGINADGEIVGRYYDRSSGALESFLATPERIAVTTPEPESLALVVVGLAAFGVAARSRRGWRATGPPARASCPPAHAPPVPPSSRSSRAVAP